jgi:hypothetical protein
MKQVKYSLYQKLIVTIMPMVIVCETTKDINEKLSVDIWIPIARILNT